MSLLAESDSAVETQAEAVESTRAAAVGPPMLRLLAPGEAQELQADIRQILRAGGEGSLAATQLALVEPTLLRERERERESFIRNNLHNGVVSGAARG